MTALRQRLGKPHRNPSHLVHIRSLPCMICGMPAIAHHLLRPWNGVRGMSRKSGDENAVPLCDPDHRSLHAAGDEDEWFKRRLGSMDAGRDRAKGLWNTSPYYKRLVSEGKD